MPTTSPSPPLFSRERMVMAGLLLLTAIVRGGVLWAMRANLQDDPDAYREIAENILTHGVYGLGKDGQPTPTAYRPPLYPIVLSNLPAADGKHVSLVKVGLLHVLLGVGTVWLTYLTARRLCSPTLRVGHDLEQTSLVPDDVGRPIPRLLRFLAHTECGPTLAALLVACDPILLNQQTLVMTETLATFLAILALWCLARVAGTLRVPLAADGTRSVPTTDWWNAGLAGGVIGLAALCRPTFLPWLGLVAAAMILDFGFWILDWKKWGQRLANVATLAVAAAAVMSPWAIRNQQEFGKPILTTTHGGYTLLLGNNRWFFEWQTTDHLGVPWNEPFVGNPTSSTLDYLFSGMLYVNSPSDELELDEMCYAEARAQIQAHPSDFIWACLYRIRQLWSPLPHKLTAEESTKRMLLRYVTAAWYCGVFALAAVGIWRLRWKLFRSPWVWGVLLCLTFTAVHTLYWCNLRMRAPLMPFVALVAAAAIVRNKPDAQAKGSASSYE